MALLKVHLKASAVKLKYLISRFLRQNFLLNLCIVAHLKNYIFVYDHELKNTFVQSFLDQRISFSKDL